MSSIETRITRSANKSTAVQAQQSYANNASTPKEQTLRVCTICNLNIMQDNLYAHYSSHFYENPRCLVCDKLSTNPSCFATHLSSHTEPQFQCLNCDKWFKQVILYKKHKRDCDETLEVKQDPIKELPVVQETYKIRIKSNFNRTTCATQSKQLRQCLVAKRSGTSIHMTKVNLVSRRNNNRLTAPKLISQTQELKPGLQVNRNGFEDLAFVPFSCKNFPTIAQLYCELYPRKTSSQIQNYSCASCDYSFPCEASLKIHLKKFDCKCMMETSKSNLECARQCLNELVHKIESETQKSTQATFLACVGLLRKEFHEQKQYEKQTLEAHLNKEMSKINHEYIDALNKYKISCQPLTMDTRSPNKANLVRCKKQKKNQQNFPLVIYANNTEISQILKLNSVCMTSDVLNSRRKRKVNDVQPPVYIKKVKGSIESSYVDSLVPNLCQKPTGTLPPKLQQTLETARATIAYDTKLKSIPKLRELNDDQKEPKENINQEENCLAKCKLCSKIFNGKHEILEHIVNSHQKMVRLVINRMCSVDQTSQQKPHYTSFEQKILNSF